MLLIRRQLSFRGLSGPMFARIRHYICQFLQHSLKVSEFPMKAENRTQNFSVWPLVGWWNNFWCKLTAVFGELSAQNKWNLKHKIPITNNLLKTSCSPSILTPTTDIPTQAIPLAVPPPPRPRPPVRTQANLRLCLSLTQAFHRQFPPTFTQSTTIPNINPFLAPRKLQMDTWKSSVLGT